MNISSSAICRQSGCTYRQLDYWIRRGWIEATASGSGSGYQREYSSKTADQIAKATELMAVGFTPELALGIAKRVVETGAPVVVGNRLLTVWAPRA